MITISLNDERITLQQVCTVAEALELWGYDRQKIAVAINSAFVPRSQYQQRQLQDSDCIDVVAPVQGG